MKKILIGLAAAGVLAAALLLSKYGSYIMLLGNSPSTSELAEKNATAEQNLVKALEEKGVVVDSIGKTGSSNLETENVGSANGSTEDASSENGSQSGTKETGSGGTSNGGNTAGETQVSQVEKEITEKYYTAFVDFKSGYEDIVNKMLTRAKSEYAGIPEKLRTPDRVFKLGMKYLDLAEQMEAEADQACEELLKAYEAELKAKGLDTGIINEIRAYYENYKETQKQYYLSKIKR